MRDAPNPMTRAFAAAVQSELTDRQRADEARGRRTFVIPTD